MPGTPSYERLADLKRSAGLPDWAERFFEEYEKHGNKRRAADAAGVTRRSVNLWIQKHEGFRVVVDEIERGVVDDVEQTFVSTLKDGIEKVGFGGERYTDYPSPTAYRFYLERRKPERYADKNSSDTPEETAERVRKALSEIDQKYGLEESSSV